VPAPRVLIVDDDPAFGDFVRKVAQGCGFDVLVARDTRAFETAYGQGQPDLVMLDLQMPGADGVELLRVLADRGCTAPIVVMSGVDAKVVDTARRLGAARGLTMGQVISKPIRVADLREILNGYKEAPDHVG
jgi:two-component system, OmpR family, response regulator